ncbi:DsbA family protein [Frigidibacter albus]
MKRRTFTLAALSATLVAGGSYLTFFGKPGQSTGALPGAAFAQDAGAEPVIRPDFVLGQADAPIEVIEYASYTCPHCAHFHTQVFPQPKANYIDTGKVKFIHREVYFDKFGLWAGMVAQCSGEMRYYGVSGMIYDTQAEWIGKGDAGAIADNLRKIGAKAGLSKEQLDACMNDGAMAQSMVATYQKHATDDDVQATPTLIIDGEKHSNMSYDDLAAILDAKLAQ